MSRREKPSTKKADPAATPIENPSPLPEASGGEQAPENRKENIFDVLLMPESDFYGIQRARLICLARGWGASPAWAEEIVQEAWLDAVKHRREFRSEEGLRVWLEIAVYHRTMDKLRRLMKARIESLDSSSSVEVADPQTAPRAKTKRRRELLAMILTKAHQMKPEDSYLLYAHYLKERNYADLAKETGRSVNAIRNRVDRLLKELRRLASEATFDDEFSP